VRGWRIVRVEGTLGEIGPSPGGNGDSRDLIRRAEIMRSDHHVGGMGRFAERWGKHAGRS
jgi:hypothetical protein